MTIERISFPQGERVDFKRLTIELRRLAPKMHRQILRPGHYDLTPTWWRKNTHRHLLEVLDSGRGVFRAVPRYLDAALMDVHSEMLKAGGMIVRLPEDQNDVLVSGILPDRKNLGIYEIISYVPSLTKK